MKSKLYYEVHVTIDPVFDARREVADAIAKSHGFKLAKLIMRKKEAEGETPAQDDTFMTGHGQDYEDMVDRTTRLVKFLQHNDFVVRRYKIEDTLADSRLEDVWNLLKN